MEKVAHSAAPAAAPAPARGSAKREPWVASAWFLLGLEIAWVLYLSLRQEGRAPILAYVYGPVVLTALAFLLAVLGAVTSFLHRPIVRRGRVVALAVLALVVATASYPMPFPTRHERHVSPLEFQLPVQGEWTVVWGGEAPRNLLARTRADRRYGLDLTIVRDGALHAGAGDLEDYFAFGQPVLAPCDGIVARTESKLPDRPPGSTGGDPLGNYAVLQAGKDQYVVLANLKQGSVRFGPGGIVERGEVLAEVGNSAFSPFTRVPHLAVHLQDAPEPLWGQAIPWRFARYRADGQVVESGLPVGQGLRRDTQGRMSAGQRVEALP